MENTEQVTKGGKPIIEHGMLLFMAHIIELKSIIGISSLYRKRISELDIKFYFEIFTASNIIEVSINISALEDQEGKEAKYMSFREDYILVKDQVYELLKERYKKSTVIGPIE